MEERSSAVDGPQLAAHSTQELQEMAYLLLEDCRIEIFGNGSGPPLRQWINVDQSHHRVVERLDGSLEKEPKESNVGLVDDICRRCNLVLRNGESDASLNAEVLTLDWEKVHPFHGAIQDSFSLDKTFPEASCSCHPSGTRAKRSDAALLSGLLVACREQVSVVRCSVMFREEHRGSLLFALAFPHLSKKAARRSILAQKFSKSPSSPYRSAALSKPLSPALQLLLSLVRADWDRLEGQQQILLEKASQEPKYGRKKPSFFPSKLTLGEVYNRIEGSTSSISTSRSDDLCRQTPTTFGNADILSILPLDLLVEKISPFLQAKSLAALRSSSTYMNWSLRGVVPGLKLRLYSHQVNSLAWLRRRESPLLRTETDYLKSEGALPDGDVHRAITGGATVRLVSKPAYGESSWCVRLDPLTGREIAPDHDLDKGALPRRVARGGLLCDDPGLGKTITVLSLILQTCGLSTALETKKPSTTQKYTTKEEDTQMAGVSLAQESKQNDTDAIFRAYWEERVGAQFRGPAMLKLVNELSKRNAKACALPLSGIKKAIARDVYGANFSAFECAVV
jgi:hypothetical protein